MSGLALNDLHAFGSCDNHRILLQWDYYFPDVIGEEAETQ